MGLMSVGPRPIAEYGNHWLPIDMGGEVADLASGIAAVRSAVKAPGRSLQSGEERPFHRVSE